MLKLENSKKLFIIAVVFMVLMLVQSSVLATNTIVITGNTTNNIQTIPTTNQNANTNVPTVNSLQNNSTQDTIVTSTNNNNSTYTNQNLPKTGVDYSALFIIAICVISGVYAYIKIRDYNQIKY